ncbi:MAG: hypothetical protein ACMXYM_04810 [Candidatus Woesearchaeota archaeon]
MNPNTIYALPRRIGLDTSFLTVEQWERRLRFVDYEYRSGEIVFTAIITLLVMLLGYLILSPLSAFVGYLSLFIAFSAPIIILFYPLNIHYYHVIGEYNEEMLKAILRLSTFVSMNSSVEYAVIQTRPELSGILRRQFDTIIARLERRDKTSLGDAIEPYIPIWNEHNPTFVKSFRLLQTASFAAPEDRQKILDETVETVLWNYTTMGKRFAEDLSEKAKRLIMLGVLFPIMSLMLLPMVTIFLPDLLNPSVLAFLYIILFPMITLILSLNFAAKRVQVSTIRIEESAQYEPMGMVPGAAAVVLILLGFVVSLLSISQLSTPTFDENVFEIIPAYLASAMLAGGVSLYAWLYTRRYDTLWNEIREVEEDLPHLLQSFSTYLTLNLPVENVIPEVVDDYEQFGFSDHPIVGVFRKLQTMLSTTKMGIKKLTRDVLPTIVPSRKVSAMIEQIVSFSDVSSESSAKAAKMIREQQLSLRKLDDYMKTLLSDTMSLINITTTMLAPLLSAAAVLMAIAIVKSLIFIEEQLLSIGSAFGVTDISLSLIDVDNIISPQIMLFIIGVYLVELIIVLTYFSTIVNIGNDKYKVLKNLTSNMLGFVIYSIILFGGYIVIQFFFSATFG